jgi:hypothetical protein
MATVNHTFKAGDVLYRSGEHVVKVRKDPESLLLHAYVPWLDDAELHETLRMFALDATLNGECPCFKQEAAE